MKPVPLLLALAALAGPVQAADWPRWQGPSGTGRIPAGWRVPASLPAAPRVLWRVPIGLGQGSPVVAGGKVFYLDNQEGKEVAHAASAETGKEIWRVVLDDVFADSGSPPGPRSTPTVDGDRVYVLSCRGEFRCLRVADGRQVWRTSFMRDFGAPALLEAGDMPGTTRHGHTASPLIDGDRMFMPVGGLPGASMVCFDKRDGRVLWRSQDDVPGHTGPVMATLGGVRHLVCYTSAALIGLAPADGALLWRVPIKTLYGRHVTTPAVVGDTVVVGSYTAGLIGVRVTKSANGLSAVEAWNDRSLGIDFSSPAAVGAHVYCIGPGGRLFCVEARTGARAWVEVGFFSGMLEAGFASFLVAGPNLLILAEGGLLMLVPATPTGCKLLAKAQVCGPNWCSPAYSDGKLTLRDGKELICVDLVGSGAAVRR